MEKKFRLCKNEEFVDVIKNKCFTSNKAFTVYIKKNDYSHVRVGLSVGKKHGNAVVRNKVKRQLRMMVSHHLNYKQSFDYLIMIRPDYFNNTYQENEQLLIVLLDKINKRGDI